MEIVFNRNLLRRMVIALIIGAPLGGVAGYGVGAAIRQRELAAFRDWSLADLFSLVIALGLLVSAGYAAWAATSARRWNEMVEYTPPDEPVDPTALVSGRRQALVTGLAGLMLGAPPILAHLGLSFEGRALAAGGIGVLLLLESWINYRLWRDGDELTRAVITQSGAVCFWLLQLALFAWAALTRLKLAPEADAWTIVTAMMGVYLLVGLIVAVRRGMVPTPA